MSRNIAATHRVVVAIEPGALRTSTVTGTAVDCAKDYQPTFILNVGVITDGTHTWKIQDSDDNQSYADVAAANYEGDAPGALSSTVDQCVKHITYTGGKRYTKMIVTVSGSPQTGGYYDAVAEIKLRHAPYNAGTQAP